MEDNLDVKRNYNTEIKDTDDHQYAYGFDFDVPLAARISYTPGRSRASPLTRASISAARATASAALGAHDGRSLRRLIVGTPHTTPWHGRRWRGSISM